MVIIALWCNYWEWLSSSSVFKIILNIFWSTGLLVMKFFNLSLSWNVFISILIFKSNFPGYGNLDWQFFTFRPFCREMWCYSDYFAFNSFGLFLLYFKIFPGLQIWCFNGDVPWRDSFFLYLFWVLNNVSCRSILLKYMEFKNC